MSPWRNVPRCTSNVTYKGALQGATAHTVWVGDVLIPRPGMPGPDPSVQAVAALVRERLKR